MISIIIPTYNRFSELERCISSLVNQSVDKQDYEILVIDNGSTDNTKQLVEKAISLSPTHHIKYFYEPIPGLLSGRHRGVLEARGEILIFVDDDIEADTGWLQAINNAFDDPIIQLVGGRNLPRYEVPPPQWLEWFWTIEPKGSTCIYLSLLDFGEESCEIDPTFVWGLNFSIRRQALLDVGGFHPDCLPKHLQYFQGDGETGPSCKAKELGYKALYHPKALVWHRISKERMTPEYFDQRLFYQGVCDSYSQIRKHGRFSLQTYWLTVIKAFVRPYKRSLFSTLRRNTYERILSERFWIAYQQGYLFHQQFVHNNPELLFWVLKKDYWDYTLPDVVITKNHTAPDSTHN